MEPFQSNQRWYSTSEPELGLGIVTKIEGRMLTLFFPARDASRTYESDDAPLARAVLNIGSHASSRDGQSFKVLSIKEDQGTLTYIGENSELHESDLSDTIDIATPENRLKSKQLDKYPLFDLRYQTLSIQNQRLASPLRGFSGGRIKLYPHQLYIAKEVCQRHQVRVLLSDEVGLGKTIEAALIIHRLLLTGRIERALILVPDALVHQWFAELYLRFNLSFRIVDQDYLDSYNENPDGLYLEDQLMICPFNLACGITIREAPWDLVAVDEAHHFEPGSDAFELMEDLSKQVHHLLLLSATPEQYGEKGHFHRLQLLDPARFKDYEAYLEEHASYRSVASIAKKLKLDESIDSKDLKSLKRTFSNQDQDNLIDASQNSSEARETLLNKLLDQHGIGRLMFRNIRQTIGGFPTRLVYGIELDSSREWKKRHRSEFQFEHGLDTSFRYSNLEDDPRMLWLKEFLEQRPEEKVVILCANRLKTEHTIKALVGTSKKAIARFHENMSLIERDRQAAWFSDASGPQCLVSSPIGAEGRNFQCAQYLVLMDLPLEPEQLEQRIGRLDRIGQGEEIYIYHPYCQSSPQARLFQWYDQALSSMEQPWHGSRKINERFLVDISKHILEMKEDAFAALIEEAKSFNQEVLKELENGRDVLLEFNSYNPKEALAIAEQIDDSDQSRDLEEFMIEAFDRSGLDAEEIAPRSYALKPNLFYTQPFPGFKEEGMAITFDRSASLKRDEWHYLSWDSPMVRDALDLIISNERGNASIAKTKANQNNLILEAIFVIQSTTALHLHADRFFPPTPIRLACDMNEHEINLNPNQLKSSLEDMDGQKFLANERVIQHLDHMLKLLNSRIKDHIPELVEKSLNAMKEELEPNIQRLEELSKINPSVKQEEIDACIHEMRELQEGLSQTQVRLDALRLIVCYPSK